MRALDKIRARKDQVEKMDLKYPTQSRMMLELQFAIDTIIEEETLSDKDIQRVTLRLTRISERLRQRACVAIDTDIETMKEWVLDADSCDKVIELLNTKFVEATTVAGS